MTFDPDFDLRETISEGFSAALETYQNKIADLEKDLEDLRDDFDSVEQERDELQTDYDLLWAEKEEETEMHQDFYRKTDRFADDLRSMANDLEQGLV